MPNTNSNSPFVTLYDVFEALDKEEDRGGRRFIGRFSDESTARTAGKGKGIQGRDVEPTPVPCIVVEGIGYEVKLKDGEPVCASLRDSVLNRMDPEDRKVLEM